MDYFPPIIRFVLLSDIFSPRITCCWMVYLENDTSEEYVKYNKMLNELKYNVTACEWINDIYLYVPLKGRHTLSGS